MKKLIGVIFLLGIFYNCYSQINYEGPLHILYDINAQSATDTLNLPDYITSDFGPRYLAPPRSSYDWHQGIDFSPAAGDNDVGYRLRAINSGTIAKIGASANANNTLFYIAVDNSTIDFGYVHIFPSNSSVPASSGGFMLVNTAHGPFQPDHYGIITPDSILLSDCNPCSGYYYVLGTDTIPAVDTINVNDFIAPLGDSGTGAGHLHLNYYEGIQATWGYNDFVNGDDESLDPFQHVDHMGPDYEVTMHHDSINSIDSFPEGFKLEYPGTNTQNLMARAKIPNETDTNTYNSASLNISKTEFRIQHQNENEFDLIQGPNYFSKIWLGATSNDSLEYPLSVNNSGNLTGHWGRTGIMHFAYRDAEDPHPNPYSTAGGRPWDDFYFADFVTRIHENDPMNGTIMLAKCSVDSRYKDGNYEIYSEITDVRDSTFHSDTLSFVLDNWKPFIEDVVVFIGDDLVYDEAWNCQDSCVSFENQNLAPELTNIDLEDDMEIMVTSSEPLANLYLSIPNLEIDSLAMTPDEDSMTWDAIISESVYNSSGLISFHFSGEDVSSNHLISFPSSQQGDCFSIPVRDSDSTFVDLNITPLQFGIDSIHGFQINCAAIDSLKGVNSGDGRNSQIKTIVSIISPDIIVTETYDDSYCYPTCDQGFINIDVQNEGNYYIEWSTGDSLYNLTNLGAGTYAYTITDDYCGYLEGEIELQCTNIEIQFETTPSCDNDGTIISTVTGGESPYSYTWVDDPNENTTNRSGLGSAVYTLVVTDSNGCINSASVFVMDSDPIDLESMPVQIFSSTCSGATGKIKILWQPAGGNPPFEYFWSNGYEGTINDAIPAGSYVVTVVDSEGCTNSKSYAVNGDGQPYLDVITSKNTCPENPIGEISIGLTAEVGPLTYNVPNGVNYNIVADGIIQLTNLAKGDYCVTITDIGNGCFTEVCESIDEITNSIELTVSNSSYVQNSCDSGPNGSIHVSAYGGIGSLSYSWSDDPNESSRLRSFLLPGSYTVTVSDECNNEVIDNFNVIGTTVDINIESEVSCVSAVTGSGVIDLTVTGSNEPYSYYWSDFSYSEDLIVYKSGTYSVTIVDNNGCSIQEYFQVGDTEGDLNANILLGDVNNCSGSEYLEIFASTIVTGGIEPYFFSWQGGGSGEIKSIELPLSDSPQNLSYSVTITDNCNQKVILSEDFMCDDVCPDNCVEFRRDGHPGCVDVCGDAGLGLPLDNYLCDEFEIKSTCDDGVKRIFYWGNAVSETGVSTTFEGEEVTEGVDEKNVTQAGPGWANAWVKNESTGCVKWMSIYIPEKCFSLWNWIWDCKSCESIGGTNIDPPNDNSECLEWDYTENDDCSITWKCVDPPNTFPDIIDPTVEYCIGEYDGGTEVDPLDLLYESCDCDWIGNLYIEIGNYDQFCPCSSLNFTTIDTSTTNIKCSTNPKDVYYDFDQESYIYLTSEYGVDSLVIPYVTNEKFSLDKTISLSSIKVENGILQSVSLDSSRNIILHIIQDSQDKVIKYDSAGQIMWDYKFDYQGVLDVYIRSDIKDQTTLIATYSDSIVHVVINDLGDIISTILEPVVGENFYSISLNSYINIGYSSINENQLTYFNVDQSYSWEYILSKEIIVKKYFVDIYQNIIVFYNYLNDFTMEGNYFSLPNKISSGVFVLDSYGQYVSNHTFNIAQNFVITDISQGRNNEFALIGYYSNNPIQNCTNFYDSPEVCSFFIGLDMNENTGIGSREKIFEAKQDLIVYPNPSFTSTIKVSLNTGEDFGEIQILDSRNNLIYQEDKIHLTNLSSYEINIPNQIPSGVYILNFKGKKINVSKKIIFAK